MMTRGEAAVRHCRSVANGIGGEGAATFEVKLLSSPKWIRSRRAKALRLQYLTGLVTGSWSRSVGKWVCGIIVFN
jgi:hypothetical protein